MKYYTLKYNNFNFNIKILINSYLFIINHQLFYNWK